MAAQRMIRDWTNSKKVDKLSYFEEVFFMRLMMKADDFGRYTANLKSLNGELFPFKDDISNNEIEQALNACQAVGLLFIYEVEERKYLEIIDFGQRKRIMKSRYPEPLAVERQQNAGMLPAICSPEVEDEKEEEDEVEYMLRKKSSFIEKVKASVLTEDVSLFDDFVRYWTETSANGKKMRYEAQKYFDIKKRFATFEKNKKNWTKNEQFGKSKKEHPLTGLRNLAQGVLGEPSGK